MVLTKTVASIFQTHGSSYLLKSTSTRCRPQTPWLKSRPGDSGSHVDYRLDVNVDLMVWLTPNKLYSPQVFSVTNSVKDR